MTYNAGGMLTVYQLESTETTKAKELAFRMNKECKFTQVCGMLITGQQEGG